MTTRFIRQVSSLIISAIVLVPLFGSGGAILNAQTTRIPDNFFGMHIIGKNDWPTAPVGALGKGGMSFWPYIEAQKGHFDWSGLDSFVTLAATHKVSFYYSTSGVPPWAAADTTSCRSLPKIPLPTCTSIVANLQDWDDFVTALVTRYKGKIQMYELWNEPDQPSFTGTIADMVALTQHEYNIIRAIDPGALIASPSAIHSSYMDQYWGAGGVKDVDIVSIHGYPAAKVNDVPESIGGFKTQPLRKVMVNYGIGKPIWDTEASWGNTDDYAITDPDLQAAFLARHFILHWSNRVMRFYWYAWNSPNWGNLWNARTGMTSAAVAYQQVHKWMSGATMPQSCAILGTSIYFATYSCPFVRPGGYQALAVWNTTGPVLFSVPSGYTHYLDLKGNSFPISTATIVIGLKPILLEN
jgi:hypothetical protein